MDSRTQHLLFLWFSCLLLLLLTTTFSQTDRLERGHGTDELTSANGVFKLGFYSLGSHPQQSYLKIYYAKSVYEGTLWIGNRDIPVDERSATLRIDHQGSLTIVPDFGSHSIAVYTVNSTANTSAVLENSGNLKLQETRPDGSTRVLWQSFDHPTNVLLPGMKLGMNLKTGQNWSLTSWRDDELPEEGEFTLGMDPDAKDELVIWRAREVYWRSGPWKYGDTLFQQNSYNSFSYVSNEDEIYFQLNSSMDILASRDQTFLLLDNGGEVHLVDIRDSVPLQDLQFAGCSLNDSSPGCTKQKPSLCKRAVEMHDELRTGSMTTGGFKYPESDNMNLAGCRYRCFSSCSCVAYAYDNLTYSGCEIWNSTASFRETEDEDGAEIYVLDSKGVFFLYNGAVIFVAIVLLVPVVSIILGIYLKFQGEGGRGWNQSVILRELGTVVSVFSKNRTKDGNEVQLFPFEVIVAATNYFSSSNKLGQGGYGPVYKGKLPDGQEIAVKRLSRSSRQGLIEFKNEAVLISKLQHTNLVRLLGFCIQGDEKILIYEFMPNGSLDFFVFDCERRRVLNWTKRYAIIEGIAQGMLYLHKYSRLKVIHRDLKASNILLDQEMNPKISDFGLARILGMQETQANTNRVVGTHGYMSPEYAFQGHVSVKTDVFSFGVLLLEIISGKKNNSLYHLEHPLSLTGFAWELWNDGRALEITDSAVEEEESCPHHEILRCIHVGLLCVQDNAADRPNMLEVVSMLSNPSVPIPAPKQPAYFFGAVCEEDDDTDKNAVNCSVDEASITVLEAR